MDKRWKLLFIVSIALLLLVFFILIKRHERKTLPLKGAEGRQKSSVTEEETVEKQERPGLPEEPEKEPPLSETEPLLN